MEAGMDRVKVDGMEAICSLWLIVSEGATHHLQAVPEQKATQVWQAGQSQ